MRKGNIAAQTFTICPTFNPSLDGKCFTRTSIYGVSGTNGSPHRLTPLDPDSGPRSSQTNTEPGRMNSRLSSFVSRLVIRGRTLRATASKMMWLSRVFLTRTSVNVGPRIVGTGAEYEVWKRRKLSGDAFIYSIPLQIQAAVVNKTRHAVFPPHASTIPGRDHDEQSPKAFNIECSKEGNRELILMTTPVPGG